MLEQTDADFDRRPGAAARSRLPGAPRHRPRAGRRSRPLAEQGCGI